MRLDKPIGTLLLLWPTLSALWLAAGGAPRSRWSSCSPCGTVAHALRRMRVQRLGRPRFRCARQAHGRPSARARRDRAVGGAGGRGGAARWPRSCSSLSRPTSRRCCCPFAALAIAIAYPFFKRFFALPQAFLGIAFSFGIPMAFAAVHDTVPPLGVAAVRRQPVLGGRLRHRIRDGRPRRRRQLGMRTSALTFGRFDVAAVAVCYALYFAGMAWVGVARATGRHLLRRTAASRRALGRLPRVADPRRASASVLPRVPVQSLARLRGVRRHRARLCGPAARMAATR